MDLKTLLEEIDIVEYISQYIELEQKGDEFWGLSCFKEEKTPSFSVRPETRSFYDFSSGIGGNLYTFVRYHDKCSPSEAYEKLLRYAGEDAEKPKRARKLDSTRVFMQFANKQGTQKESVVSILPPDTMLRYEDDREKLKLWADEGISYDVMENFQVRYDRFADRIVYPIRDVDGNIVNIGGRTLDPDWKAKKLRKYNYYYKWGRMQTIYGIAENREAIREEGEIILFEGCKSVLKAASWGIHNCGAILTSHLSPDQMRILINLGCNVVFALDKDVDIRKDHNIGKLRSFMNVFYLKDRENLLSEKDAPVDNGEEVFRKLYERRLRYR